MPALVCRKRSYVDESPFTFAKKLRRFYSSAASPPPPPPRFRPHKFDLLHDLHQRFPSMASQVIKNVAEQCDNDVEAAIALIYKLNLGELDSVVEEPNSGTIIDEAIAIPSEDSTVHEKNATRGEEFVQLLVTEMKNATSIDDAKAHAARVLQKFEKAIRSHTTSETAQDLHKENLLLKEQLGGVVGENTILKRAVAIQLERHKGLDDKVREVEHMKELVTQYQEQLRRLGVKNYALAMHLQQALPQPHQSNFTHGRFPPDVF